MQVVVKREASPVSVGLARVPLLVESESVVFSCAHQKDDVRWVESDSPEEHEESQAAPAVSSCLFPPADDD